MALLMAIFLSINLGRLGADELVQPPRRAGGPMSDATAEQRLPMQRNFAPGTPGALRDRVAAAQPVRLGVQHAADACRRGAGGLLILPPLFRWAVTHATMSGQRPGRVHRRRRLLDVHPRAPAAVLLRPLSVQRILARRSGVRPAGGVLHARCCASRSGIAGCGLLLLLTVFPALAIAAAVGRRVRPGLRRHHAVGRADARRDRLVRHRRRIAAAGHPARVRPALAVAGRAHCCRSATSSCGAACRC